MRSSNNLRAVAITTNGTKQNLDDYRDADKRYNIYASDFLLGVAFNNLDNHLPTPGLMIAAMSPNLNGLFINLLTSMSAVWMAHIRLLLRTLFSSLGTFQLDGA